MILQAPEFFAQGCLVCISVLEAPFVYFKPFCELSACHPSVMICVINGFDGGLVNHILDIAFTLQGAGDLSTITSQVINLAIGMQFAIVTACY